MRIVHMACRKVFSKQSWIDREQGHKGVVTDIENQIITLYLKDGEQVDLKEAYQSIRKGGYEPRTFHLRVQGLAVKEENKFFLQNNNGEALYELVGDKVAQLENESSL